MEQQFFYKNYMCLSCFSKDSYSLLRPKAKFLP